MLLRVIVFQHGTRLSFIPSFISILRSSQGLKGQLLRGGLGSLGIKIASTALSLVLAIVLARLLGAEGFGTYSFVFAVVTILAIPAQMGLPNLVVRETAKAQSSGRWDLMKSLWRWSTLVALGMSVALVIVGGIAVAVMANRFTPLHMASFAWAFALVPLVALGNLRGAALRGLRHVVQGQLPEFILRPLFLVAFVLGSAWLFGVSSLDASSVMMLHVFAATFAFFIGLLMLARKSAQVMRGVPYAKVDTRPWLAAAVPMALMEGMLTVNDNIGLLVFGAVASTEDVGLLKIALQLSAFVTFGFLAVNTAITPYIARFHAEGAHDKLRLLALRTAQISTASAVPVAAIFLLGGRQVIHLLFGADYEGASLALAVLTAAQVVNAFTGCAGALLYMTGHEVAVAKIVGASCLLNLLLTLVLGMTWGVTGAAIAAALAIIFWNVALFFQVHKTLNINCTAVAVV